MVEITKGSFVRPWGTVHPSIFSLSLMDPMQLVFISSSRALRTSIFRLEASHLPQNDRGCANRGPNTLQCLRSASTETLALAGKQVLLARPATLFVFAPNLDGDFIRERPVEALKSGNFARVPVLFGFNSDEGARWSAGLTDPSANTSMPNATEETVFNFLRGQYASLGHASFSDIVKLYPLKDYANSFSLQGQQMYGECRYICTAPMIARAAISKLNKAFLYR